MVIGYSDGTAYESAAHEAVDQPMQLAMMNENERNNPRPGRIPDNMGGGGISPEAIAQPAIRHKNEVFTGINHADAIENMGAKLNYEYPWGKEIEQGFTTTKGRFIDREEALDIANKANQIKSGRKEYRDKHNALFEDYPLMSEDLIK